MFVRTTKEGVSEENSEQLAALLFQKEQLFLDWLSSIQPGYLSNEEQNYLDNYVSSVYSYSQAQRSFESFLEKIKTIQTHEEFFANTLKLVLNNHRASIDPDFVGSWIQNNVNSYSGTVLAANFAKILTISQKELAVNFSDTLPEGETREQFILNMVEELSPNEPQAAFEYFRSREFTNDYIPALALTIRNTSYKIHSAEDKENILEWSKLLPEAYIEEHNILEFIHQGALIDSQ